MINVKRFITNLGVTQIFLSLLLIMSVMAISTYSIYRSSISSIYDNVKENNKLATQSTIQFFDNTFQTVNNMITSIEQMPPYKYPVLENGNLDSLQAYTYVNNLKSLLLTTDYIEEIIVFYDEGDIAITTKGTLNFDLLFNKKYINETYSAAYWNKFLKSEHPLKVFPGTEYQVLYGENNTYHKEDIMFIVSGNRYKKSTKNVIVVLDVDKLMTSFGQSTFIPGSSLKVLDQNHNAIFSTDENLELVEVLNDIYFTQSQQKESEFSMKKENFEYTIYTSDYNDFVYINKVPFKFQNLNSVALGNRTIITISIASAILLSILLSIYLFRPVKVIMRMLGGENSKGNDFSKIQSAISRLLHENNNYKKQLNYMDVEMKRTTFLQILDDYSHTEEHELQLQKYYPDFFISNNFLLAQLTVRENKVLRGYSIPIEMITAKIQKSFEKEEIETQVFHYLHDQFVVIISLHQANSRDLTLKKMAHAINNMAEESLIGFQLWACVSKAYRTNIENCRNAYKDVENAYKYRNVNDTSKVMDADKINFVWNIYFPYENMEKISNYIIGGRIEESIAIVKETLQENIERNIHDHQIKYVAKSIFFYLFRNIGSLSQSINDLYEIENEFNKQIEYVDCYEEIEQAIVEVVKKLAKYSNRNVKVKLNPAFITQYIELHYMENMYLDHIAEVMETSPKYFSNYFKKTFGVNYIEHLNKVRLTHAREMLKETNLSIGEVGEKTGYMNASTFTTTFKKYYGISPSEFRKQVSAKGEEE
ncbi:MAG TPA: AraC family transcriptional regulator [Candidatus Paenibacillus intestinavium]|nr:AraC family transcriptional regulator [Candidatus Paenibacillus intestinavium]